MVFKVDTNYSSWRRKWQPTLIFLPGKSRGQRNLVGYSPWGHKESVTTEHMSTNYSSLSLPYVYAACHILGTVAVFIVYFYIDDSVERAGPFQFSSIQLLSCVRLFATPWTSARQASLSIINSWSPLKPMSIESVMPPNHLNLCCPLLLLPSIFPSIRVFSNELTVCIRWPKYWSFNFNVSPSNEHSVLISFRAD